jgi:hypothetical protein
LAFAFETGQALWVTCRRGGKYFGRYIAIPPLV